MSPVLTTVTPFWGRPEMLEIWLQAVIGAKHPEVANIIFFVGEDPPSDWVERTIPHGIQTYRAVNTEQKSIAHYHDQGFFFASSEWVMKLDIDCLPNVRFFESLLSILRTAKEREWFNCGMFYVSQRISETMLSLRDMPVSENIYRFIMGHRNVCAATSFDLPAGSNFICRRKDYLDLGGSDKRFRGYGWEDYQQLYMLERNWLGSDPLTGRLDMSNVTQRCRDEISRKKAFALWDQNPWLCLLHRWHPPGVHAGYREAMQRNKRVLLDYIERRRA